MIGQPPLAQDERLKSRWDRQGTGNGCNEGERSLCRVFLGPYLDMLDRIGCGGAVVTDEAGFVEINRTAERIIDEELLDSASGRSSPERRSRAVARLLRRRHRRSKADACTLVQRESKRPLAFNTVSLRTDSINYTMIVLVDLNTIPEPNTSTIQKMFGLTPAEAKIALQISRGHSPTGIAEANGVTISTVRSQLAAVFAKTQTQRQVELVTLLARLSVIP
jgi:DNA-binding CsgD family transcriptional regulator